MTNDERMNINLFNKIKAENTQLKAELLYLRQHLKTIEFLMKDDSQTMVCPACECGIEECWDGEIIPAKHSEFCWLGNQLKKIDKSEVEGND